MPPQACDLNPIVWNLVTLIAVPGRYDTLHPATKVITCEILVTLSYSRLPVLCRSKHRHTYSGTSIAINARRST